MCVSWNNRVSLHQVYAIFDFNQSLLFFAAHKKQSLALANDFSLKITDCEADLYALTAIKEEKYEKTYLRSYWNFQKSR